MTEFTAGEQAYLDSGGTDSAALIAENPTLEKVETPVEHKIEPEKAAPVAVEKPADAPAAEPPEPGEEEIPTTDGKSKRRMVDSRALKAEREKARGFEAELKAERETRARIDERLKMLSEAVSSAEPVAEVEKPAIPDPEQDIFGYAKYLAAELEALKTSHTATQAETNEQRQKAALISGYQRDAANFESKQPDFKDAYNYLFGLRKQQLEAQRYSPKEVEHWLEVEETHLVQRAFEGKTSPAQDVYNLAKSMGYAQKAPAAVTQAAPAAQAAPATAAKPAPAAPLTAPSVTDEIDRIKAGKAASISLSNGGGGGAEEMSLEWLADAPLKEFQAFMDKPGNREKVERAMGKAA